MTFTEPYFNHYLYFVKLESFSYTVRIILYYGLLVNKVGSEHDTRSADELGLNTPDSGRGAG